MELHFHRMKKFYMSYDSGAIQAPRTYNEKYPHAIYAFDVTEDVKRVTNQRLFTIVSPGFPDGMRLDASGKYLCGGSRWSSSFQS